MQPVERYVWEYLEDPSREDFYHYKGYSICQFILTSDIVVHSWENLSKISLNVFSCKNFDESTAEKFCKKWFNSKLVRQSICITRY